MKSSIQNMKTSFGQIFSFENDESKGRIIALTSTLLTTVYNVFVTGIFYTGFLSMYGMTITDAGVLTFIPYLCNMLSLFSPKLLNHFKKRKAILLTAKVIYYFIYVVLITVMPQFVTDPDARLGWFVALSAISTSFYALFSSGITNWMYCFYPKDNDLRLRYLTMTQMFSSILSSIILLGSGFLTDALSNSPHQDQLILIFRYFAFVLVLLDVFITAKAREYPYEESAHVKLSQVFTLPFQHRKFLYCMILMFIWNFASNLNNGLWNYHLLNHMNFSYTTINTVSVTHTVFLIVLMPIWNRILRRYSWVKTLGISFFLMSFCEIFYFLMTPERSFIYLPNALFQTAMSVGSNLAYANLLYLNLPKEDSTAYITFNTIGINIFGLLGLITGTWVSSITGDERVWMFGMNMYSVQFTTLMRGLVQISLGLIMIFKWRSFTSDAEINRVDWQNRPHRRKSFTWRSLLSK